MQIYNLLKLIHILYKKNTFSSNRIKQHLHFSPTDAWGIKIFTYLYLLRKPRKKEYKRKSIRNNELISSKNILRKPNTPDFSNLKTIKCL